MIHRILRIYADTSVFGGVLDDEFCQASRIFFAQVERGGFWLICSDIVGRELREAPGEVRQLHGKVLLSAELIEVTAEVLRLQQAYLDARVLEPSSAIDALHVALATVARADMIVSWNFRHIVHFEKIRLFNAVNQLHGWDELEIRSPKEVIAYEDEGV